MHKYTLILIHLVETEFLTEVIHFLVALLGSDVVIDEGDEAVLGKGENSSSSPASNWMRARP